MNKKIVKLGERTNLTKEDVDKITMIGISGLLALTLSIFTFGLSNSNAAETKPGSEKDKTNPLSERCGLKPERGPCKAMFDKYFFDAGTNKCKQFTYGGCDGVVPFETQEECEKACVSLKTEAPVPVIDPYPVTKYGAAGIRDFKNAK
jgi:hypothetical protein